MHTLNLGILAHVDAGKTSLTERLLYAAGVIDEIGSVDDGNTQTDSLALERQRGITIKSAVVSFSLGDITVNLIDTPGHPDFIAEVERVLHVLDGAVLVISAVEGVQSQTRVLMRTLRQLGIPTLIFVNKIDRSGAGYERVLDGIAEKLTPAIIAMGTAHDLGTRDAGFTPYDPSDDAFADSLIELLADCDEDFLAAFVADESMASRQLDGKLNEQIGQARLFPVYFGSAITGAGFDDLIAGIRELLPAATGDPDGPFSASVFKIERGTSGEKIAYARVYSGSLSIRERLTFGDECEGTVTGIDVFAGGTSITSKSIAAGQIGRLRGLNDIQIGDMLGAARTDQGRQNFAPPTLETIIMPRNPANRGSLHVALTQLEEQDPLINLRRDEMRQETLLSLYGEVQKEVIQQTLADDFGIDVEFSESTTICVERPAGSGAAFEIIAQEPNPFLATVGIRVDPAPLDTGIEFRLEVELGSMPLAFFNAVEEAVHETLRQGLHGWEVTDCTVTMTHSGYWARQSSAHGVFDKSMSSTAGDFRNLTPLVLMDALKQAGTTVYEPVLRFYIEMPEESYGPLLPLLATLDAIPDTPRLRGETCLLEGQIPAARLQELQQRLPGMTRGEGVLESEFDRYAPVSGEIPVRPRSDHNPLDRKEYLLHVLRRV